MEQLQQRNDTNLFRELRVLRSAQKRLTITRPGPLRILSFGCSIGDELVTLRCLFPDAEIVGCDIDPANLAKAAASAGNAAHVVRSDEATLRSLAPFDLITAMSVLCRNPKPQNFTTAFPFTRFDETTGLLAELLAPGGLLALVNTSYRFRDSSAFSAFDPVRSDIIWRSGFVDVMTPEGRDFLIQDRGCYRLAPGLQIGDDEELTDSLWEIRPDGRLPAIHWVYAAPVPEYEPLPWTLDRGNTDTWPIVPDNVLTIRTRYEFGMTPTGIGAKVVRSWRSLVHDGDHVRPATWETIPHY